MLTLTPPEVSEIACYALMTSSGNTIDVSERGGRYVVSTLMQSERTVAFGDRPYRLHSLRA